MFQFYLCDDMPFFLPIKMSSLSVPHRLPLPPPRPPSSIPSYRWLHFPNLWLEIKVSSPPLSPPNTPPPPDLSTWLEIHVPCVFVRHVPRRVNRVSSPQEILPNLAEIVLALSGQIKIFTTVNAFPNKYDLYLQNQQEICPIWTSWFGKI